MGTVSTHANSDERLTFGSKRKSLFVALTFFLASIVYVSGAAGSSGVAVGATGPVPPATVLGVSTSVPPAGPQPDPVSWVACPANAAAFCASMKVPLDYNRPTGQQISIALIKIPAAKPAKRIGTMLVNPGGPGSSGVAFASRARRLFGATISDRFDIIGFDPRGVGQSVPVDCLNDTRMDAYLAADPTPDTAQERTSLRAVSKELATGCNSAAGKGALAYFGTLDVARDMDQIRKLVGEQTISMMGFSYGTLLGATYAELFPQRVRAFVLDGGLDSRATADDRVREQTKGFEAVLNSWAAKCSKRSTCTGALRRDPLAVVDQVLASVESEPISVGARQVGPGEAVLGIVRGLYSERNGWPTLDIALIDAAKGKGASLLAMADDYSNRNPQGRYDGVLEANTAINCTDVGSSRDPAHYDELAAELKRVSSRFGAAIAYGNLPCAYWPGTPLSSGWSTVAKGSAPILVVGTTNDPATPYVWSKRMAEGLDNGVLLTNRGDSHTAYFSGGPCVRKAIEKYLVTLIAPAPGTVC
jgi:pimeloyl-ACP methyl ester carboxylesterase